MKRRNDFAPTAMSLSGLLIGASALALLAPTPARAQSVNYTELEQMFGEPVTTSVTGKPQRASDAAASLIIITRDDIRRSPSNDIPGLLKSYAGIDVARWTAANSDVAIRGGIRASNPSLLVLVNGRQIYLDHHNSVNWNAIGIQIEEIQQIEVVKGPNSALYGFNAATGVVNIITVHPLQSQQVTATFEAGTQGGRRASITLAQKLAENIGLRLSAGYERGDEFDRLKAPGITPGTMPAFDPRRKEASGELNIQLDDRTEASAGGTWSDIDMTQLTGGIYLSRANYRTSSVGARIARDMDWGTLSARLYKNWMEDEGDIYFIGSPIPQFQSSTMVAAADALWRAGPASTLRFGLEYRANQFRQLQGYPGLTRYTMAAGSGMWEQQLSDRFRLTLAGRIDHLQLDHTELNAPTIWTDADYDRNLTAWSFNGSILAALDANSSLRIAGGRGTQLPSLVEFGLRSTIRRPGIPFPLVIAGNPSLKPVTVWSGEIGYVRSLASDAARLELTAFFTKSDDLISLLFANSAPRTGPPATPFMLWAAQNIGGIKAYGVEASLSGKIGNDWTWRGNYSWTKVDQAIEGNGNGMYRWPYNYDSSTPRHKVNAQLSYEHGPLLATLLGRYISGTTQLAPTPSRVFVPREIPDSFALDAKLSVRLHDNVTVSLTGENLTNARGATLSPIDTERRIRASVKVQF